MFKFIKLILGTNISLLKHDRDSQTDMAKEEMTDGQGTTTLFYKACRKWKLKIGFVAKGIKEHTCSYFTEQI